MCQALFIVLAPRCVVQTTSLIERVTTLYLRRMGENLNNQSLRLPHTNFRLHLYLWSKKDRSLLGLRDIGAMEGVVVFVIDGRVVLWQTSSSDEDPA